MAKRILLLIFSVSVTFFASCSSEDNGGTNPNAQRVKRITQTIYDSGTSYTTTGNFIYNGNVLQELTSGTSTLVFDYDGDKVTTAESYTGGVLERTNTFSYEGVKLVNVTADDGERTTFSYSGNILAGSAEQYFDEDAWVTSRATAYVFTAGNMTQKTTTNFSFGTFENRHTYSFDSKNNPLRNMNPYIAMLLSFEGITPLSGNNAVSAQTFSPASETTPSATYTYEIDYDGNDFPTNIKCRESGVLISETVIQYQ